MNHEILTEFKEERSHLLTIQRIHTGYEINERHILKINNSKMVCD